MRDVRPAAITLVPVETKTENLRMFKINCEEYGKATKVMEEDAVLTDRLKIKISEIPQSTANCSFTTTTNFGCCDNCRHKLHKAYEKACALGGTYFLVYVQEKGGKFKVWAEPGEEQ